MFKTIRVKTMAMHIALMTIILGLVYLLFLGFFDEYYFSRKTKVIEKAYHYLEESDIDSLKYSDEQLVKFRNRNLKIVIADENFKSVFADERPTENVQNENETSLEQGGHNILLPDEEQVVRQTTTDARIERYIINRADKFKNELSLKNRKNRIRGRGIITQKDKKYYVYIYETKEKMRISFSYTRIFLLITGALAIVAGIIVSIFMSNKISKPISQIESIARKAPENGFDGHIEEEQSFNELSSLAKSINIMLGQIRNQMQTLEEEIAHKTIVEDKRRQFVNNVSHEMKTPLAIISSQVEMLALIDDEQKREEYCQSIVEETTNMSEMINDMIVVYAAQNDNETIALDKTDIGELVEELCGKYDDLLEKNNLTINVECEKDCFAKINERYISQAIDNYITNAVKHSPENAEIGVRVISNDDCIRVEVENQGSHIPEQNRDKVWDMFFKGDDDETLNGQKGSGLGLYLVKSIVELHGGNYGYRNLKKGIVFWLELPKVL